MYVWYPIRHGDHWILISNALDEIYGNEIHETDVVVLGACNYHPLNEMKKNIYTCFKNINKIIVYQLEPLTKQHFHSIEKIVNNIQGADEIWDYDIENIQVLKQHGIEAKYRPLKKCNAFKNVDNIDNPDIDLLFYGTFSPHRVRLISELVFPDDIKPGFIWLHDIFDNRLNEFIGRSKIILNLNQYDGGNSRQQQPRIIHALSNNKCVLSEKNPINQFGEDIVEFEGWEDGVEKLRFLLTDNNWKNYPKNRF